MMNKEEKIGMYTSNEIYEELANGFLQRSMVDAMYFKIKDLQQRINKAIEYIKDSYVEVLKYYDEPSETASYELVTIDLLKILGGDVDDE